MLEDLTKRPHIRPVVLQRLGRSARIQSRRYRHGRVRGRSRSPPFDFGLGAAERELFEAQLAFEAGEAQKAGTTAYRAMLHAAKALVKLDDPNVPEDADRIVSEFRTHYFDTQKFWDPVCRRKIRAAIFSTRMRKSSVAYN